MGELEREVYGKIKGSKNIGEWNAKLTPEQRAEHARRAAEVSTETRRRYRTMRDLLKQVLVLDVDDPGMAEAMRKLGLEPSRANAIALSTVGKAGVGDVEAARFVRDTVGEKPTEAYNIGVSGKPVKSLDLSGLSDEQLEQLADEADN